MLLFRAILEQFIPHQFHPFGNWSGKYRFKEIILSWKILRTEGCWHAYMAISFWEGLLLGMAVVDFLLVYMGDLPASLNFDRCYLVGFSGSRGTFSAPHILRIGRVFN